MRNNKVLFIAGTALLGAAVLAGGIIFINPNVNVTFKDKISGITRIFGKDSEASSDTPYRDETNWDGESSTSDNVYKYPFNKGFDEYISNTEYSSTYKDIFDSMELKLSSYSSNFLLKIFNSGYRDVEENKDEYIEVIETYLPSDVGTSTENHDYAEKVVNWLIDSKYQGEATYTTDHSLIWKSGYTYIRGELNLTIYNCEDEDETYKELFPSSINVTEDGTYVVDLGYLFDTAKQDIIICSFENAADVVETEEDSETEEAVEEIVDETVDNTTEE